MLLLLLLLLLLLELDSISDRVNGSVAVILNITIVWMELHGHVQHFGILLLYKFGEISVLACEARLGFGDRMRLR